MKDQKDILKLLVIFGTLLFNALLIYYILYIPFDILLAIKSQPFTISPPQNHVLTFIVDTVILILIATSAFMLWKVYKTEKIFIYAPLSSITVLVGLIVAYYFLPTFPDSTSEYSRHGYYYKTETWLTNNKHIYKRWRSELPYDSTANVDNLKYVLDSSSNISDK